MGEYYKFVPGQVSSVRKPKKIKKGEILAALITIIVAAVVIAAVFFFKNRTPGQLMPSYVLESYRLVPEKVSQSAPIRILLPNDIDAVSAMNNVKFFPEIKGTWQGIQNTKTSFINTAFAADNAVKEIVFKPAEKLELNKYYSVELVLAGNKTMKEEFLAVEDPKIIAVFPRDGVETPENTEITVVFNRPIVPLTTLSELETKDVPVEIAPFTEGKFKWITPSNLQFIPKNGLIASANYTVNIKSGFVSIDGLPITGGQYKFTTRNLRFIGEYSLAGVDYSKPFLVPFNQPINIDKTANQISILDETTGQRVPFVANYYQEEEGIAVSSNPIRRILASLQNFLSAADKKTKGGKNQSIIQVVPQNDQFGRAGLWDFNHSYQININKAYSVKGDINMEQPIIISFNVHDLIKSFIATSERTYYAAPGFFDPQGKLLLEFYEEINLKKSSITAANIRDITYGQKCTDPNKSLENEGCIKIDDKTHLFVTFDYNLIQIGQPILLTLEKIVNIDGLQLNSSPVLETVIVYPEFQIYSVEPELALPPNPNAAGIGSASLKKISICSNTPIKVPDKKEEFKNLISSDSILNIINTDQSFRVPEFKGSYECQPDQFETMVEYRLDPNKKYSLNFSLNDVFGQYKGYQTDITTTDFGYADRMFYEFQDNYSVTSPSRTQLTFAAMNLDYVDLRICKLTAQHFLDYVTAYYEPDSISGCQEEENVRLDLPKKYWIKNYFKVDVTDYFDEPLGHYALTFSNPNLREGHYVGWNQYEYNVQLYPQTFLTVTNLAVAQKESDIYNQISSPDFSAPEGMYWVSNIANLLPVENAKISIYNAQYSEPIQFLGTVYSDSQGITKESLNGNAAIISKGKDSTVLASSQHNLNWASGSGLDAKTYLYTDRPIYRPGQIVNIKGICRVGYDGNYENCLNYADILNELEIYNSKYDKISTQEVKFNNFGTFNTEFALDKASPLGSYRICLRDSDCSYFEVEEYKPAAFEVKLNTDKEDYISKDKANIAVEANYYFGLPLEKSKVEYTLSSQNYYFDKYQDEYFSFGAPWYYDDYYYGDKFLLRGETELSDNGKANINLDLDLSKYFKDDKLKSKILILDVTVITSQGQSISSQKSFIVHAGEYYLGLYTNEPFLAKNQKTILKVKSVDVKGNPISKGGLTINTYKVDYIYSQRQDADGGYNYDWDIQRKLLETSTFSTDSSGNFSKEIKFSSEGEYYVEVIGKDRNNNQIRSSRWFYVYGDAQVQIQPYEGSSLDITSDKTELNVGDTASVIIKSPYPSAKALISLERGKIFDYEIKEIKGNLVKYTFPIKEEYFPNIFLTVLLQSTDPEVKYGSLEFKVGTKLKDLNIDVKTDKKTYLPGEKIKLDITATDYINRPVQADISLAVVDLSVLALKGNPKKNPVEFFYGGFPLTIRTSSNIKSILKETSVPAPSESTKGGGGNNPDALAKKARGEFKDTAYWQAMVRTNVSGKASIEFILPDNLTTWQTEALAVTQDTKLGVGYSEFATQKPLMITVLKPRFIIPGDMFEIGVKIFNQSLIKQSLNVTFTSQTLALKGNNKEELSLDPGKTKTIYFKVEAPLQIEEGIHKFNILAKANDIEDQINESINITPSLSFETTASAGYTNNLNWKEYIFLPKDILQDKGEVSIKASATLGVFLSDGLKYLISYPYGCSEQIASRLNAIAIIKRGLNLPNVNPIMSLEKIEYDGQQYTLDELVQIGLNKLYNNQNYDGGFTYWGYYDKESNPYLTSHVLETLKSLQVAGFRINQDSIDRAEQYLSKYLSSMKILYDSDRNDFISISYSLVKGNTSVSSAIKSRLQDFAKDKAFLNDRIGTASLAKLTIVGAGIFDKTTQKLLYDTLTSRIRVDSRGAFLEPKGYISWRTYETTIQDTALYLKAIVAYKNSQPIVDKVLRWLVNSRSKDGAWGSTNNTLHVVDAMVDYLKFKRETESNFTLSIAVNDKEKGSITFGPNNIFDQLIATMPLTEFNTGIVDTVDFTKKNLNQLPNNFYYDMALKYYLPAGQLPPRDEGISVVRNVYKADDLKNENPVIKAKVGEILRVNLLITIPKERKFVAIEDYIPAGTEIVNMELATEQKSLRLQERELQGRELWTDFKELRDNKAFLFREEMNSGVYEFDYYIRAFNPGTYSQLPAMVYEMYTPENFGRSASQVFTIN